MNGPVDHGRLPRLVVTLDGFALDPSAEVWLIRTPISQLTFDFDLPGTSVAFQDALRGAMARRLSSQLPQLCYGDLSAIRVLARHAALTNGRTIDALTLASYRSYVAGLPDDGMQPAKNLVDGLRRLAKAGFAGLADDLALNLPVLTPHIPPPNSAVGTMCPREGALTRAERSRLMQELRRLGACGEFGVEAYALSLLAVLLAPRPSQLALLKVEDYRHSGDQAVLRVPRVKRRDGTAARSAFAERPLVPALATAMADQSEIAASKAAALGLDPSQGAMFPAEPRSIHDDFPQLEGFVGHSTAVVIGRRVTRLLGRASLTSDRTGDTQVIGSRRLRRTLATSVRAKGGSYAVIGRVLDHDNGSTAPMYCEDTPDMIARIDAALRPHLAPLAALFLGPEPDEWSDGAGVAR